MAGPVGSGGGRRRVFVLVDGGIVRGIFNSWDDAEAYADEKRFSLDHLMEYQTRRDFPDHLHLMQARWENDWVFQGQWSKQLPRWNTAPREIRLDHYHFKGAGFELFRQKEFEYLEGILDRINPMAPDSALVAEIVAPKQSTPPPMEPRLSPLRPVSEPEEEEAYPEEQAQAPEPTAAEPSTEESEVPAPPKPVPEENRDTETGSASPLMEEPPPEPDTPSDRQGQGESTRQPAPVQPESAPEEDRPATDSPKPPVPPDTARPGQEAAREEPEPDGDESTSTKKPEFTGKKAQPTFPEAETGEFSDLKPQPRISFQKKSNPLRLKTKGGPQPIPSFKPTTAPPVAPIGKHSSVELAYAQQEEEEKKIKQAEQKAANTKRVWSLRLIFTVIVMVLCWGGGLFWVLRPKPTATSLIAEVTSLASARVMIFEPDMVFFQLEVDPIHQERWVKSLNLKPIPRDQPVTVPTYHALDTWTRAEGFVRPPYSLTEVDEWLNLRTRKVAYGFSLRWEDGSIIILDLESDMLIGWGYAVRYPELLN